MFAALAFLCHPAAACSEYLIGDIHGISAEQAHKLNNLSPGEINSILTIQAGQRVWVKRPFFYLKLDIPVTDMHRLLVENSTDRRIHEIELTPLHQGDLIVDVDGNVKVKIYQGNQTDKPVFVVRAKDIDLFGSTIVDEEGQNWVPDETDSEERLVMQMGGQDSVNFDDTLSQFGSDIESDDSSDAMCPPPMSEFSELSRVDPVNSRVLKRKRRCDDPTEPPCKRRNVSRRRINPRSKRRRDHGTGDSGQRPKRRMTRKPEPIPPSAPASPTSSVAAPQARNAAPGSHRSRSPARDYDPGQPPLQDMGRASRGRGKDYRDLSPNRAKQLDEDLRERGNREVRSHESDTSEPAPSP